MSDAAAIIDVRRRIAAEWRRFLAWWVGELAGMVPAAVRAFLDPARAPLVVREAGPGRIAIDLHRGGAERTLATVDADAAAVAAALAEAARAAGKRRSDGVSVLLQPDQVLVRTLAVPQSAEAKLHRLLCHEIERRTSLTADEVYLGGEVTQRDRTSGQCQVAMLVAERVSLAAWHELADASGTRVTGVLAPLRGGVVALFAAADATEASPGRANWRQRLTIGLAVCATIQFGAAAALDLWHTEARLAQARADIAGNEAPMRELAKLNHDMAELRRQADFLAKHRSGVPVLRVIDEAARILPDQTWLASLQIAGNQAIAVGSSGDAAGLVKTIEASPLFHNVHFRAPVVSSMDGKAERFDVSFDIVAAATP
jgi:general secretion pathway protein L